LRIRRQAGIRIDAKRQALDSLDNLGRGSDAANGKGTPRNEEEIATIVESATLHVTVTSQSAVERVPASNKLLIPLERRDGRVV